MKSVEAEARSAASPEAVWALIADASAWSRWGSWSDVHVEGGGEQLPGAVRVLVRPPFRVRERILAMEPPLRTEYELIDGLRVRGYRSTVTIEPADGGGALVRWRSTWEHAGPLTALLLRVSVRDACRRLAKAAG